MGQTQGSLLVRPVRQILTLTLKFQSTDLKLRRCLWSLRGNVTYILQSIKMCHASISSFWFSHLHWSSTSQLTSNWEDVSKEEVTFILPCNTSIGSQSNDIKCCIPISKDSGDDIGDAGSSPVPLRRRVNKGIKWKVYLSLRSLCMLRLSAGLYIVIGL